MIKNVWGLRELSLKKNNLGDKFGIILEQVVHYDNFMRVIDCSFNKISAPMVKQIAKSDALKDNLSLIALDLRFNMNYTPFSQFTK